MNEEQRSVRDILASIEKTQALEKQASETYRAQALIDRKEMIRRLDGHSSRIKHLEDLRMVAAGAMGVVAVVGKVLWDKIQGRFHVGTP